MNSKVLWHDKLITLRCNYWYPILIETPNGQNVKSIEFVNYIRNIEDGSLIPIDVNEKNQPKLFVMNIAEKNNNKTGDLSFKESKKYILLESRSKNQVQVTSNNGEKFNIGMYHMLETIEQNKGGRGFCSFVLIAQNVQNKKPPNLYSMCMTVTMSDGQKLEVVFKYITPSKSVGVKHKNAASNILYTFYTKIKSSVNDTDTMNDIVQHCETVYPDFNKSFKCAERTTSKRKRDPNPDDAKRTLTTFVGYVLFNINWIKSRHNYYWLIVSGVDNRDGWVIDNVETSPMVNARIRISSDPSSELVNNPNMYKGVRYGEIIENAKKYAKSSNHLLLWMDIDDSQMSMDDITSSIHFTMRRDNVYANVATNVFNYTFNLGNSEYDIIASLKEYADGGFNKNISKVLEPQYTENDFTNFFPVDNILGDDLDEFAIPSLPPAKEYRHDFFQ